MINVMYCGNEKVFDGILLSLLSMIKHTKEAISCYLLTMDLHAVNPSYTPITSLEADFLTKQLKEINSESSTTLIDLTTIFKTELENNPNMNSVYTPYCLLRLFADKIDLPDKIIYLDIDTMLTGDIAELYNIDVIDYEFAASLDYMGRVFRYRTYCNSGVLLLNLSNCRKSDLLARTRYCITHEKLWFPDQDALNKLANKKKIIPFRFNEQRKIKSDTVIKHFCKGIKWLPFYHVYNIKQWQIEEVQKKLKIHCFDDVFEIYRTLKKKALWK